MSRCVNENCNKDPMKSPNKVMWGCDADFCCDQACYDAAKRQMDHFCSVTLKDDGKFAAWMGVPKEWIKTA